MKDPIYHQLAQSENIWNHFATLIFMNWIKKFNLHAFWFYEEKKSIQEFTLRLCYITLLKIDFNQFIQSKIIWSCSNVDSSSSLNKRLYNIIMTQNSRMTQLTGTKWRTNKNIIGVVRFVFRVSRSHRHSDGLWNRSLRRDL